MTDNTQDPDPRIKNLVESAARLVRDGIADTPTAIDHVLSENKGRELARRINAQRGQQETK